MWFDELVGFSETPAEEVRRLLRVEGDTMISTVNGRRMRCGTLEVPSLADLRARTPTPTGTGTGSGRMRLRQVVGDAGSLHRDPANAGALFQAASQFNLLEMVSPDVTPEAGVTGYQNDPTQGPACAVACGAGTILRNYFVDVRGRPGQTADNQIDCLSDIAGSLAPVVGSGWTMRNGYAMFDRDGLDRLDDHLARLSPVALDEIRSLLRIGLHRDVEVTAATTGHLVTQAYCSALPVAYNQLPSHRFERFARLVLEAAYEATLRAAACNAAHSATVYLTLLGGGVFGNDEPWIIDAIERACTLFADHPLDVAIVSYRGPSLAITDLVERFDR